MYWLIDCLIDWLIGWWVDELINLCIDVLMYWGINWWIDLWIDGLIEDLLIDGLIEDWLINWLIIFCFPGIVRRICVNPAWLRTSGSSLHVSTQYSIIRIHPTLTVSRQPSRLIKPLTPMLSGKLIWIQNFCVVNFGIEHWSPSYADLRIYFITLRYPGGVLPWGDI